MRLTKLMEMVRTWQRRRAMVRLRKLRRPLPAGFVFNREEANSRKRGKSLQSLITPPIHQDGLSRGAGSGF